MSDTMPTIAEMKAKNHVPVIVANHEGLIVDINPIFTEILGWHEEDVLGEPLTMILPDSFRDGHNLAFSRFRSPDKISVLNHPLQLKTLTKNGEDMVTEHLIIAEKIDGQWFFAASLTPLP